MLAADPGRAVPLVRKRLSPAVPADPQRLARLIADLDSDRFAVRQQATTELERFGELAEPAIAKALEGKPTAEVSRQLEQLREAARGAVLSPTGERLRGVRAVELLERIGTPEARACVEALAGGAPEAGLTQEAKATRQRLERRVR